MTMQTEYTIKIPVFEGPFDLLFHLVKKAEVDIWQISIADITDQYLSYLQSMKELNLDIASEFLVMAATLLRLKSKLLLPRPPRTSEQEDEDDLYEINSAEELFLRLEEYRIFKGLALYLREREEEQQKIFLRSTGGQKVMVLTRQESVYTIWEGANHLSEIMLRFAEATKTDAYNPTFSAVEDYIIVEKSAYIETLLRQKNRPVPMADFITADGLWELIITFISLLELTKQRKITMLQEGLFKPIMVMLREIEEQEEVPGDG